MEVYLSFQRINHFGIQGYQLRITYIYYSLYNSDCSKGIRDSTNEKTYDLQFKRITNNNFQINVNVHAPFLQKQFYKNEAQVCPKIKNKLRTTEARL